MEFTIGETQYIIDRDKYCWMLFEPFIIKSGDKIGQQGRNNCRYFSNYYQIARYLLNKHVEFGDIMAFKASAASIAKTLESTLSHPIAKE